MATETSSIPNPVNLKPWTEKKSFICNKLKEMSNLILLSFFKCMSTHCRFATNDDEKMLQHLESHDMFKKMIEANADRNLEPSWMECAYCDYISTSSCADLLEHVKLEHGSSMLQCPYCYYRTRELDNIMTHLTKYHEKCMKNVLVCDADPFCFDDDYISMIENRRKNVFPLPCGSGKF